MAPLTVRVLSLLFVSGSAFRVKPKSRGEKKSATGSEGRQPAIAGIFAYAAPGSAQPGLVNPRGGPCFPGVRTAAVKHQWFGQEVDTVCTITGVIGFRHPMMDFKLLDLKDDSKNKLYSCDSEVPNRPRGTSKVALHDKDGYANATVNLNLGWGTLLRDLAKVGIPESYNLDRNSAHRNAQRYGWNLIGSVVDNGGDGLYIGKQVSHLFQKPSSKECMLTFMGTTTLEDWAANFNIQKKPFCGYSSPNAYIADHDDTSVLGAGESLVHKGFQDALMQIVNNTGWQSDVRPKLSSCSKVYVTGHSLGAAQAELFGACINMAPAAGTAGYEHYKWMSWRA